MSNAHTIGCAQAVHAILVEGEFAGGKNETPGQQCKD
jgi:hypothetical protein